MFWLFTIAAVIPVFSVLYPGYVSLWTFPQTVSFFHTEKYSLRLFSLFHFFLSTPFKRSVPPLCVVLKVCSCCPFVQWSGCLTATNYIEHIQVWIAPGMAVEWFRLSYSHSSLESSIKECCMSLTVLPHNRSEWLSYSHICIPDKTSYIPTCSLWHPRRHMRGELRGVITGLRTACTGASDAAQEGLSLMLGVISDYSFTVCFCVLDWRNRFCEALTSEFWSCSFVFSY